MSILASNRSRIITLVVVVVAAGVGLIAASRPDANGVVAESLEVETSFNVSTLTLSGRVTAKSESQIGFPVAGTIDQILVDVGDRVEEGQLIAQLSTRILAAEQREIEADIAIQEAVLADLLAGSRPEEVAVEEENLALAELTYKHLQNTLPNQIFEAYTVADNAILNTVDDYIDNSRSNNPTLLFFISRNQSLKESLERNRVSVERTLEGWQAILSQDPDDLETSLDYLTVVRDFMNLAALAVNSGDTSATVSDTLLRTWKTNTATARSAVVTALTQLESLEQQLETARREIDRAESRLALVASGATPTSVVTQRQTIERSRARLATLEAQRRERTLRAPLSGIVAQRGSDPGESVAAGAPVVTIISGEQPLVVLEAPELTLPEISLGDRGQVTLLALDPHNEIFGTVTSISPQARNDNGLVPYYEIDLTLDENELSITPGLIADALLTTEEYPNSIAIPRRYLISQDLEAATGEVWLMTAAGAQRQQITLGSTLSDQRIIVTDGLRDGDIIVRLKADS
jgi:HlyD family secretion protein